MKAINTRRRLHELKSLQALGYGLISDRIWGNEITGQQSLAAALRMPVVVDTYNPIMSSNGVDPNFMTDYDSVDGSSPIQ